MNAQIQDAVALADDFSEASLAEATLEAAIEVARVSMLERQRAGDIAGARDAQAEMCDRIGQRTAAVVERMERARGLR